MVLVNMVARGGCLLICSIILLKICVNTVESEEYDDSQRRPNIVVFLADDLGYGDLSCYGNAKVKTKNIDQLAREGLQFMRMYSQPICTPSRAALMTGRFPARSGMVQGMFNLPVLISPAQPSGLPDIQQELNLASSLQALNYSTHFLGKWHLGYGHNGVQGPMAKGFDQFYGIPMTHAEPCSNYWPMDDTIYFNFLFLRGQTKLLIVGIVVIVLRLTILGNKGLFILLSMFGLAIAVLRLSLFLTLSNPSACLTIRDTTVVEQPYTEDNITIKMTNEAVTYLKQVKEKSKSVGKRVPFFLMVSYLTPHVPPIVSKYHLGKSGHGKYYDSLLEMDWSVGEMMSSLKSFGFDKNTVVFFSSDNGPTPYDGMTGEVLDEQYRGSAGSVKNSKNVDSPLRSWKGTNFDGGIRVPGILRWRELVKHGQTSNAITSHMDILPTILEITGQDVVRTRLFDGKSLLNFLKFPSSFDTHHEMLFHYCDMSNIGAISFHDYKLHFFEGIDNYSCRGVNYETPRLYNIVDDPGETRPLSLTDHENILSLIKVALTEHQKSMSNVTYYSQLMLPPIPWHFPCDNFPKCTKTSTESDNFDHLNLN